MENELPLRDIHLPDPVSWFPPAIGWWLLAAFAVFMVLLIRWLLRISSRPRLKQRARDQIEFVVVTYLEQQDEQDLVQQLSVTLKRIGMSYFERNRIAGASGVPWLKQLNGLVKQQCRLSDEQLELLSLAPYQQPPQVSKAQATQLVDSVRQWASALPATHEVADV